MDVKEKMAKVRPMPYSYRACSDAGVCKYLVILHLRSETVWIFTPAALIAVLLSRDTVSKIGSRIYGGGVTLRKELQENNHAYVVCFPPRCPVSWVSWTLLVPSNVAVPSDSKTKAFDLCPELFKQHLSSLVIHFDLVRSVGTNWCLSGGYDTT